MTNPQTSLKKSVEFIKKLTVIAVSNITYLRNFFPESAYIDRQLEGLNLKILKGDHSVPGAQQMINWLKSAFEAVNLQYVCTIYNDFLATSLLKSCNVLEKN